MTNDERRTTNDEELTANSYLRWRDKQPRIRPLETYAHFLRMKCDKSGALLSGRFARQCLRLIDRAMRMEVDGQRVVWSS